MIDASKVDNFNTVTGNTRSAAQQSLDTTFEDFMVLLTTQLENQDPTDPLDTNEITNQIAQLSGVQAQVDTNTKLDELIRLNSGSELNSIVNYIGRVIESDGDQGQLISNGEQQAALFVYDLPSDVKTAKINIYDEDNVLVYSGDALPNEGRNEVTWDGYNSLNTQYMNPGRYRFEIQASDFAENPVEATTYTTGVVTAVDTHGGDGLTLSLGNIEVKLEDVRAIKTAQELL